MIKSISYIFGCLIFLTSCHSNRNVDENNKPKGAYFSEKADTIANIFAEDIVSTMHDELNAVFSPDGKEFYYTLANPRRSFYTILMFSLDENENWQGPKVAPFSGKYSDADPYITSDNKSLYFISKRPFNETEKEESKDFDIWVTNRTNNGWSDAIRLDTTINTSRDEYYVSATDDGSIFYSAQNEGSLGSSDIYEAKPKNGGFEVLNLGEAINSEFREGDPYVSPDGNMIIFTSSGREDGFGSVDLYISFKKEGIWQKAQNIGPQINSKSFDYCPMMSPDGRYFFWTSYKSDPLFNPDGYTYEPYLSRLENAKNGLGNIYWIKAEVLEKFR